MKKLSTPKILIFSFAFVIILGTIVLSLPIASSKGSFTPFLDALFTAATSTCVTGLTTVTTASHWSTFGHIVILMLIQIGGIGATALPMIILAMLGRRLSLGYNKILGDSFNLDVIADGRKFIIRLIEGIFLVEGIGAIAYMPVFVPEYGVGRGMWYSVFHSVSAFCNAGIDIIGSDSLMGYSTNIWMNTVTMILIILGGIGFIVWWDVLNVIKEKKIIFSLHSKIVLHTTWILILFGTITFLIFEFNNPDTIGHLSTGQKLMASVFQSVTTRTAGFATIPQSGLTSNSVIVSIGLMFIGGSSVGTAGGVKTVTVAIVLLSVYSTIRGQRDTVAFGRRIPDKTVKKAMVVIVVSLIVSVIAVFILIAAQEGRAKDIIFEVYSALGTAGLSRDLTPSLSMFGKIIIIICMFSGRVGPISIASALTVRDTNESTRYVSEDVTVG